MELRRLSILIAFFFIAVASQCSEARHSIHRRETDNDVNYDDPLLADEASDDEAQNDDGGDDPDEDTVENVVIVTEPGVHNVTMGGHMRLECKVSPSSPHVVFRWWHNGALYFFSKTKINAPDRYSIDPNSTDLLIKDIQQSDSGNYQCEIIQTEPVTVNHTVVVMAPPKIIRFTATNNGEVMEGSSLNLECIVTGSPPPKIIWTREGKNGNHRLTEKDAEFGTNSLSIKNVGREHSGRYLCYAFNGIGQTQAELHVTVSGKPRVHVHKTVVNSAINVEAVLQCSAHEESPIHIRWYKDGKLIEDTSSQFTVSTSGSQSNLTVIPTTDQDFGKFTCEAENSYGHHNRSIELVQSPVVENFDADGPKLSWIVHSHQPLEEIEVQLRDVKGESDWRRLSVPIPDNKSHKYDMVYVLEDQQLDPGTYEAVVKVKNNNSWSQHSNPAMVEIEAQPQYIQHASVFRGGNGAYTTRPTITAVLSTILMYLLVRML